MFRNKLIAAYGLLVVLPLLMLVAVLNWGNGLSVSGIAASAHKAVPVAPAAMNLFQLALQVSVVLLVSRLVGMLFRKFRQPQVIGEMIAGILLGPSLLGWTAPAVSKFIFPAASLGYLNALAQIGLIFFMFLVGVSLNPKELKEQGHAAVVTSHASIVMPFCLGAAVALYVYRYLSIPGVSFMSFALFMGAAMSITAFPMLARILNERNLMRSRMGTLAISCAAVDDLTGWCILAYVVVVIRSAGSSSPFWVTGIGAVVYLLTMFFVVRPLARRFETDFRKKGRLTENALSFMLVLALISALATEKMGIYSVFGAFFMGAILPKSEDFVAAVLKKLESLTVVALLPLFFAFSGLRTSLGLVHGELWIYAALIIAAAIAGKFGGAMFAARMAGTPWRDSASLGVLMNARGLMELIALNIGLDIGVISPTLFTIMVLMAVVTTVMTPPLFELLNPSKPELSEVEVRVHMAGQAA
jgi:Kef-type K+ transport system membrane component KefB